MLKKKKCGAEPDRGSSEAGNGAPQSVSIVDGDDDESERERERHERARGSNGHG